MEVALDHRNVVTVDQVLRFGGRGDASCGEAERGRVRAMLGVLGQQAPTGEPSHLDPQFLTPMHADTGWIGRHCVDPRLGVSLSKMKGRHPVDAAA